jgi:hypothetical protein
MQQRATKYEPYRLIIIDGERFVTQGNPCKFIVRQGKKKNRRRDKKGEYFLSGNKILFHEVHVVGTYKCAGVYNDRGLKKRRWLYHELMKRRKKK